jgi:hypothetical protein
MRTTNRSAVVLLATLITACDSSSPASPAQGLDTDLSVVQVTTGGMSGYTAGGTGFIAGGGYAPALTAMYPSSCSYDAATQFFACPTVNARGLTIDRKYRLLDASGAALSTQDPLAVVAIRVVIDLQGSQPGATYLSRHEDNTLSGLQTANRTLNGTATQDLKAYHPDGTVFLVTHEVTVTTDLSILNSLDRKYPLAGTIVSDGTNTYGAGTTNSFPFHREVIFDGTSVVTVKNVHDGISSMTCKVDLVKPGAYISCESGTGL